MDGCTQHRLLHVATRYLRAAKCRFGSRATSLRWSFDVRFNPDSDIPGSATLQIAEPTLLVAADEVIE